MKLVYFYYCDPADALGNAVLMLFSFLSCEQSPFVSTTTNGDFLHFSLWILLYVDCPTDTANITNIATPKWTMQASLWLNWRQFFSHTKEVHAKYWGMCTLLRSKYDLVLETNFRSFVCPIHHALYVRQLSNPHTFTRARLDVKRPTWNFQVAASMGAYYSSGKTAESC